MRHHRDERGALMPAHKPITVIPALLDSLMLHAFGPTCARTPRGHAYMAGARAYLAFCISGAEVACADKPGTDAYDAYHAGIDEGRAIWTRHQAGAAQ